MALVWGDGFDHYGTTVNARTFYTGTGWSLNTTLANCRTGTGCIFIPYNTAPFNRAVPNAKTYIIGTANNFTLKSADTRFGPTWEFRNGTTVLGYVFVNYQGSVVVYNAAGAVLYTSPINTILDGSYVYLEAKLFSHATNGTIEVRLNRTNILYAGTGLNTGGADITNINLGGYSSTYSGRDWYIDDFYINDTTTAFNNDFNGDIRCRTRYAASNGPQQDWTANNAPAYGEINRVPYDAANHFISAAAVGNISNFGLPALPTNTAYANGLMMFVAASKSDAGTCTITPEILSGASQASGSLITPSTTAAYYATAFQTDPATGNLFLLPALQALLIQAERTA